MSIENEEWVRSRDHIWVAGTGEHVADCESDERAEQVVAGKEALALIERVLRKNTFDRLEDDEARAILRRAGVLK